MHYCCKMVTLLAKSSNWSLNKTITLIGVDLMLLLYLFKSSFEWVWLSRFYRRKFLPSRSSEPKNTVQVFAFLTSSYFSTIIALFVDISIFLCHCDRANRGGKQSDSKLVNTYSVKRKLCHQCFLLDESYSDLYQELEYPVVKYLKETLYFEVELLQPADPRLELNLEDCWATNSKSQDSLPQWPILING